MIPLDEAITVAPHDQGVSFEFIHYTTYHILGFSTPNYSLYIYLYKIHW